MIIMNNQKITKEEKESYENDIKGLEATKIFLENEGDDVQTIINDINKMKRKSSDLGYLDKVIFSFLQFFFFDSWVDSLDDD